MIERVAVNPLARRVKVADLVDNLDTGRLARVDRVKWPDLAKYRAALQRLDPETAARWGA